MISGVAADALNRRALMLDHAVGDGAARRRSRGSDAPRIESALADLRARRRAAPPPARSTCRRARPSMPTLVPREHLPNAISLNTIAMQTASVAGPCGWRADDRDDERRLGVCGQRGLVPVRHRRAAADERTGRDAHDGADGATRDRAATSRVAAALEGLRFVFRAPLIRSTMLLDFFATFFSSATALLPIFAQDVLHVGARGYGWLYAAPAAGALLASAVMVKAVDRDRAARAGPGRRRRWPTASRRWRSASRRRSG